MSVLDKSDSALHDLSSDESTHEYQRPDRLKHLSLKATESFITQKEKYSKIIETNAKKIIKLFDIFDDLENEPKQF